MKWLIPFCLLLGGCVTPNLKDANAGDLTGLGHASIKVFARTIQKECAAQVRGGPCRDGSKITTEDKNEARMYLINADAILDQTNEFIDDGGDNETAVSQAMRALDMIEEIQKILRRSQLPSEMPPPEDH